MNQPVNSTIAGTIFQSIIKPEDLRWARAEQAKNANIWSSCLKSVLVPNQENSCTGFPRACASRRLNFNS